MIVVILVFCIVMMFEILKEWIFVNFWIEVIEYFFVVVMSIEFGVCILVNGLIFMLNVVI